MKPISLLCRVHDAVTDAGFVLSTLCLVLMVAIYCAEVVLRYAVNAPLDWANDVFSNLLCVTLFAMVPHATRAMAHIEINLLPELLPKLRPALAVFANLVGALACLFAAWMSLNENLRQIGMGILTEQNNPIPVWWISSFITYGFGSSALYFLRALVPVDAVQVHSHVGALSTGQPDGGIG